MTFSQHPKETDACTSPAGCVDGMVYVVVSESTSVHPRKSP